MALADPQSITVDAVPTPLPRVQFGANEGIFANPANTLRLRVAHNPARQGSTSHVASIQMTKVAEDPLTSVNSEVTAQAHIVIRAPRSGFTLEEQKDLVQALTTYLSENSFANTVKILGSEH